MQTCYGISKFEVCHFRRFAFLIFLGNGWGVAAWRCMLFFPFFALNFFFAAPATLAAKAGIVLVFFLLFCFVLPERVVGLGFRADGFSSSLSRMENCRRFWTASMRSRMTRTRWPMLKRRPQRSPMIS